MERHATIRVLDKLARQGRAKIRRSVRPCQSSLPERRRNATARPAAFGAARLTLVGKSVPALNPAHIPIPWLWWLNMMPDALLVVCGKHSAGCRTKPGPRHFCPKLTSATFAISVHEFAILAPDVLALPSRSHNRAFLRSDVPCHGFGVFVACYAQLVHKARPSWRNISPAFLRCEFVDHAQTFRLPLCARF